MDWRALYERLDACFDIEAWWPAETDFEVMVGAVLTQNTTWTSVEKALDRLKEAGILTPCAIAACDAQVLRELIRPAGSYTRKAATLKNLTHWLDDNHAQADEWPTQRLRESLLSISGIGPETADDILLYVYQRPVFIFDAYARRMIEAAGLPVARTYEGTRKIYATQIAASDLSASEYGHFHGLIVTAGKHARHHGWESVLGGTHQCKIPHPQQSAS